MWDITLADLMRECLSIFDNLEIGSIAIVASY